jgi:hypothetical protein
LTKCSQKYVLTGEATWFGNESNTEWTGSVIPTALSRCYPWGLWVSWSRSYPGHVLSQWSHTIYPIVWFHYFPCTTLTNSAIPLCSLLKFVLYLDICNLNPISISCYSADLGGRKFLGRNCFSCSGRFLGDWLVWIVEYTTCHLCWHISLSLLVFIVFREVNSTLCRGLSCG